MEGFRGGIGGGRERFEDDVDPRRPELISIMAGVRSQGDRAGELPLAKSLQQGKVRLQSGNRTDDVFRPVQRQGLQQGQIFWFS